MVILGLDIIMPGLVPKWAIFAPIFVPLFSQLGVPAQTLLAAYRVGDSPFNVVTPLMVYLPFMVTIAQRYQKDAGIGTIIALMMPFVTLIMLCVWVDPVRDHVPAGHPGRTGLSHPAVIAGAPPRLTGAPAMDDITITFAVIAAVVVLFVWGRVPVEVVAVGAALALWATGVLALDQVAGGLRRPRGPVHRVAVRGQRGARRDGCHDVGRASGSSPGRATAARGCWC